MVSEITISKGSLSLTLHSDQINDNYSSKLFIITPAQSSANQVSGPKDPKIIDLLRITHELLIRGYIVGTDTKTAKQVKDDLVSIFNGGDTTGGVVSLIYDGDTLSGFIEKLTLIGKSFDEPADFVSNSTAYQDILKYEVSLTFIVGVAV